MATVAIMYDPQGRGVQPQPEGSGVKMAILNIADGLEDKDIYAISRRLADLLLEQIHDAR